MLSDIIPEGFKDDVHHTLTEHNFTLKIVEKENILKNTLLNTKTNQINTVGINTF